MLYRLARLFYPLVVSPLAASFNSSSPVTAGRTAERFIGPERASAAGRQLPRGSIHPGGRT
jgi:hypothetical protein